MTAAPTVLVWQLDGRPHEGIDYGVRLADLMDSAGVRVGVVALDQRAPSETELRAPVHVLSGGTTLATSADPWMRQARAALLDPLQRARAGEALVLGVCLGAQVLAEELLGAGSTQPSPRGLDMGLHPVCAHAPGWRSYAAVPHFHYYEIRAEAVQASPVARHVLSGEHSEVEGVTFGAHVLALQFHPELTVADLQRMIQDNDELLRGFGLNRRGLLQALEERAGDWSPAAGQDLLVQPVLRFLADGSGIADPG